MIYLTHVVEHLLQKRVKVIQKWCNPESELKASYVSNNDFFVLLTQKHLSSWLVVHDAYAQGICLVMAR